MSTVTDRVRATVSVWRFRERFQLTMGDMVSDRVPLFSDRVPLEDHCFLAILKVPRDGLP